MEVLEGFIEDIKFKSEENGYTVAKLNNRNKSIVIVGTMPFISEGQHVKLTGEWKIHQKFGAQFNVKELEEIFPTSIEEIEKFIFWNNKRNRTSYSKKDNKLFWRRYIKYFR